MPYERSREGEASVAEVERTTGDGAKNDVLCATRFVSQFVSHGERTDKNDVVTTTYSG
jgi:hypothetical protein